MGGSTHQAVLDAVECGSVSAGVPGLEVGVQRHDDAGGAEAALAGEHGVGWRGDGSRVGDWIA